VAIKIITSPANLAEQISNHEAYLALKADLQEAHGITDAGLLAAVDKLSDQTYRDAGATLQQYGIDKGLPDTPISLYNGRSFVFNTSTGQARLDEDPPIDASLIPVKGAVPIPTPTPTPAPVPATDPTVVTNIGG